MRTTNENRPTPLASQMVPIGREAVGTISTIEGKRRSCRTPRLTDATVRKQLDESYCELIARRLAQDVLDFGTVDQL